MLLRRYLKYREGTVCLKAGIKWDLPLMRQREKVNMSERRRFLGEKRLKQAVGFSLSKTNPPDTLSEWVPNWHDAHWQRVTKMRDVPSVFWCNFATVGERLCAYQIFLTRSQRPKLDPRAGKELENMIFMSFAVRLGFSGSAADAPGLALLTPHVYGYAGEGNMHIASVRRSSRS